MVMLTVTHTPGRHCGSTGIQSLLAFHNIRLTEAMCFGLGAGLGLWYINDSTLPASRMVHVRSADLEAQFFNRVLGEFSWEQFDDPQKSRQALCERLDAGRPAIILTDIFYLPYYKSSTHFPGHLIAVWGYDPREKVFFVTDTEREDVQSVPFDNMDKARFSGGGIFNLSGNMFAPDCLTLPENLSPVIKKAIADNSRALLNDNMPIQGVRALETWEEELKQWHALEDWQWTARLAYQVIEKRGTGGGGFRLMYEEFLREAGGVVPEINALKLPDLMAACAAAWTDLAMALKAASENSAPDFEETARMVARAKKAEDVYHQTAVKI
ncbi:MAG: BtrH N-terminal domain-containing protein [Thermodesulfobacteriota bacterium]|nr:BtrH N-terminal domain-containing protein [Thermodesulfobacteriota bacterium]